MLLGGTGTCGWCCRGLLCYFEGEPYACSLQDMYQSNTEISSSVTGPAMWPVNVVQLDCYYEHMSV